MQEARNGKAAWKKWDPYLSERQWGTIREDYSDYGDAWNYFSHDQAGSRAYRWGEDGLAGISDDRQLLCFALALWNGEDSILKDGIGDCILHCRQDAVNPEKVGTKASAHYVLMVGAGKSRTIRLRLSDVAPAIELSKGNGQHAPLGPGFDAIMQARQNEADEFWTGIIARLMHLFATSNVKQFFKMGRMAAVSKLDTPPTLETSGPGRSRKR